jgi:hypothetical protein
MKILRLVLIDWWVWLIAWSMNLDVVEDDHSGDMSKVSEQEGGSLGRK